MVDNEAKRMKMDGPDRVLIPTTESDTDSFSVIYADYACREPEIELRPQDISNSKNDIPVQPSIRRNTTKTRKFLAAWFQNRPWLEYSIINNSGYCFCCNWFDGVKSSFSTAGGWTNFKHSERLSEHESNVVHKNAWKSYEDYKKRIICERSIPNLLIDSFHTQLMENREYICTVIEALLYCARQNIGIRGHREEYPTNLSDLGLGVVGDGCSNTGNFLELIKLIARHDKAIASKLNNPKKNATYLSKRVQNELIGIMGQTLRRKIISEIKESGVFSIFADETKDQAKIEQVCIGLRYLNLATNNIQERTLKVKNAEGLDASSLTNIINDVIEEYSLSWENCAGASFDGASVMSGCHRGVATRLINMNPHLWYVHCYCHRLNLALVSSCLEHQDCSDCYSILKDLYSYFSGSVCAAVLKSSNATSYSKFYVEKEAILDDVSILIEDSEDSAEDDVTEVHPIMVGPKELSKRSKHHIAAVTLKSFSKTRWAYQYRANASVRLTFSSIAHALHMLSEAKGERGTKARNLLQRCTLQFLFFNGALMELTGHAFVLNNMLQSVDCDLNQAMSLLSILRYTLEDSRKIFPDLFEDAQKLYIESNLDQVRRRHLRSDTAKSGEVTEEEASVMYNGIINAMLRCLEERFAEQNNPLYLALNALQPKNALGELNPKFLNWDMVKPLFEKYIHLIPDDAIKVEMQLSFLKVTLNALPSKDGGQPSDTRSVWKYLEHQGKLIFRSALMLYRIAHVLPVVTASAERTFSRLNIVKTVLRSTMSQERLDSLLILLLNRDLDLDIDEVIDVFGNASNRRLAIL